MAFYSQRHCRQACLARADEGTGFLARLRQLLASPELLFDTDSDHTFICALLSSASGAVLVRNGGAPLAAVWRFAERLYVRRAELRFGTSPALAWAWAGLAPRRAKRRRVTTAF